MRRFLLFALTLAVAVVSQGQQTVIWTSGSYVYDGAGNIRSIGTDKYSYDSMGRLKTANLTFPGGAATQTYGYDGFGNLTSIVADPPLPTDTTTASIGVSASTNRLSGWSYDEAGNQISDGVTTLEWDATGSMIARRVTGEEDWLYLYTASDERIAVFRGELKSAGQSGFVTSPTKATWTIRDLDAKPMAVWESSGGTYGLSTITWKRDYVWGFGRLMATIDANGTRHVHTDHLGTPRLITNASGAMVEEHEYYPFGFEATTEGSEPLKFTGHERDLEPYSVNDLDYMHARYYSPVMGRFLSVDPGKDWGISRPQSWNMYSYARNNPLNNADPTGKWVVALGRLIATAASTCAETPVCAQIVATGARVTVAKAAAVVVAMNQRDDTLLGASGPKVDSKTVYPEDSRGVHVDVENANPGYREGDVHIQIEKGKHAGKYRIGGPDKDGRYPVQPDSQTGLQLTKTGMKDYLQNERFIKAIERAMQKYLGESHFSFDKLRWPWQ